MTNGMYNKFDLIDSMIVALNGISVSGVANMTAIIETIQKLGALRDGLRKDDERRADDYDRQGQNV